MLALDDSGNGDAIVLVHGLGTTRVVWRLVEPMIMRERRVVTLDLPGFGASPPAGPGFDLGEVADAIAAGVSAAGVPAPFDLLGQSLGGAVALTLAARRPELVRKLVLSAPAGFAPLPRPLAGVVGRLGEGLLGMRGYATPLADLGVGRRLLLGPGVLDAARIAPSQVRSMLRAARGSTRVGAALRAAATADLAPLLDDLALPLGLIWGREDRVVPYSVSGAIRSRRPDAELATVERAGHIAMVEQPRAYADALEDVLARLSRR